MKQLTIILLFVSITFSAQELIKIKRDDNRFLFYQLISKNDTLSQNEPNHFLIKLPDSLKSHLQINVTNGLFKPINKDSCIYNLLFVKGMKYSHAKPDSIFSTLLEGPCLPKKNIEIEFLNTHTRKIILKNSFIIK